MQWSIVAFLPRLPLIWTDSGTLTGPDRWNGRWEQVDPLSFGRKRTAIP